MFRTSLILLALVTAAFGGAGNGVIDLMKEGRFREARTLMETTETSPRYQLLYYAWLEGNVARACSLYQVIAIRYPATDCDSVARERLEQAHDMGYVVVPITEWSQTSSAVRPLAFLERGSIIDVSSAPIVPVTVADTFRLEPSPARTALSEPPAVAVVPPVPDGVKTENAPAEIIASPRPETVEPITETDTADVEAAVPQPTTAVIARDTARVKPVSPPRQPHDKPAVEDAQWYVQVGAFSNHQNADRLAASLRADGYSVKLVPRETATGALMQVRVGGYANRAECQHAAAEIKEKFNVPAQVILE